MTYRTPLEASQRDASNGRHHAPALARRHVAGAWAAPAEGVLRCAQSACSRGACGPHICPSSTGVCASVWAHRCELGRACVGMRGHAWACVGMRGPAPGLQGHAMRHACTAAKGTAVPNIGRDTSLRATTRSAQQVHRSALAHAGGACAWVRGVGAPSSVCA